MKSTESAELTIQESKIAEFLILINASSVIFENEIEKLQFLSAPHATV